MARILLHLKAFLWRTIHRISVYCDLYFSYPLPHKVAFTRKIPSTVGKVPGKFKLLFYTPSGYKTRTEPPNLTENYPIVINFHGGGYTLGHAMDDARFIIEVIKKTSAVVVRVDYRLAPTHPFPTGIEDSVSAVLWIWAHAEEFNLDISRTALKGFSAGANFTYTVPFRLQEELRRLKVEDKLNGVAVGEIVGLVSFYPSVDSMHTREERDASNPNLVSIAPKAVGRLFDNAYFFPGLDKRDPLISPGLASDELLRTALPINMSLITAGGDALLVEAEAFRERLKELGKRVDGESVERVAHSWDKVPKFSGGDKKRDEAYKSAVTSVKAFLK